MPKVAFHIVSTQVPLGVEQECFILKSNLANMFLYLCLVVSEVYLPIRGGEIERRRFRGSRKRLSPNAALNDCSRYPYSVFFRQFTNPGLEMDRGKGKVLSSQSSRMSVSVNHPPVFSHSISLVGNIRER